MNSAKKIYAKYFSHQIKEQLRKRGITSRFLAELLGISREIWKMISRGEIALSLYNANAICNILGCKLKDVTPPRNERVHRAAILAFKIRKKTIGEAIREGMTKRNAEEEAKHRAGLRDIGKNIYRIRKAKNIKISRLCAASKLTYDKYKEIEKGNTNPYWYLPIICDVLLVNLSYFNKRYRKHTGKDLPEPFIAPSIKKRGGARFGYFSFE